MANTDKRWEALSKRADAHAEWLAATDPQVARSARARFRYWAKKVQELS